MKIREKIFLSVGTYVLVAVVIGLFAYQQLSTIDTRLDLVTIADDIIHNISDVRRYEKNYLLYKRSEDHQETKRLLGVLKSNMDNIKDEIVRAMGRTNYEQIRRDIAEYEAHFDQVVAIFGWQDTLIAKVNTQEAAIEQRLTHEEVRRFSDLKRSVRKLMIEEDGKAYAAFAGIYGKITIAGKDLAAYRGLIDKLFSMYEQEQSTVDSIRAKARAIQLFSQNLSKSERDQISATMTRVETLFMLSVITIMLAGAVVNARLAISLARPIREMERVTKKIAGGDFSEHVEVRGNDEIASLGNSFNQMEERLHKALESLEGTVRTLREKQMELVEAEKLASIGKLSAGIAHEISNPLTSVLTFSSLMLEETPEDDPRRERLQMIVRETERARNIVRQLLSFGREFPINPVKTDVNSPVAGVIRSLSAQGMFKDIDVVFDLDQDLPNIDVDPAALEQVITNLLLNAVHAITPPGIVTVMTRLSGANVEIAVTDTGCGIPPENMGKVFDPFFTTKSKSRGTGLGLAVSYGIIKKHCGHIEVESTVGRGTTFTVRLPLEYAPVPCRKSEDTWLSIG